MSTEIAAPGAVEQTRAGRPLSGVPWLTVLPLAVVLAFGDGFWVGSLRGAVGAIERTQSPFASWLRESTLSVPLFTLAVLGAITIALHRFGPSGQRPRQVLGTGVLVASSATAVGIAVLATSAFYDYRLQLQQDLMMGTMRQTCTGACLVAQDRAAFWLQMRSVGWGSLILLATNLVLVGWAVAFMGGRLRVSTPRPAGSRADGRSAQLSTLLVVGLVGSAVIHVAVVPEHLTEWAAAGSFFVLLTLAELAAAAWLVWGIARPSALFAAAVVSAGPLLLWLWSRTTGLPFGPEPGAPEAVGVADVAACLLEVVTLVLAVALIRGWMSARRADPSSTHLPRLALVALVAVTALGLAGSPLAWFTVLVQGSGHGG
jgi:hypothetical protein